MSYRIIQHPFTLKLREMSNSDLKQYFKWFLGVIPERVSELTNTVNSSPGYENWQANQMPDSLNVLGEWFATQINVHQRSHEDIQRIKSHFQYPIEIPNEVLTEKTYSIAIDVGIYLSQVLLKVYPMIKWEQQLDNKRFADYGQPVLVGLTLLPLNPLRITITLANGLAIKKQTGSRLKELFDYWSIQLTHGKHIS